MKSFGHTTVSQPMLPGRYLVEIALSREGRGTLDAHAIVESDRKTEVSWRGRDADMRTAALIVLVWASWASAAPIRAADVVAEARAHWRDLDYDQVIEAADRALAITDAPPAERLEALRLKVSARRARTQRRYRRGVQNCCSLSRPELHPARRNLAADPRGVRSSARRVGGQRGGR